MRRFFGRSFQLDQSMKGRQPMREQTFLQTRRELLKTTLLGSVFSGTVPGLFANASFGSEWQSAELSAKVETTSLPFTMSVTSIDFDSPPEYFGGGSGNPYPWVDFPVCPVVID